jgi:hypothetical protein
LVSIRRRAAPKPTLADHLAKRGAST